MPNHSVCHLWLHIIWGTKYRIPYLTDSAGDAVREMLVQHADELGVELRTIYVNPDHVHLLLRLRPDQSVATIVQHLKGRSSRLISKAGIARSSFGWAVGYAAFSVSASNLGRVSGYIKRQAIHHRRVPWTELVDELVKDFELHRGGMEEASPG